MVKVYEVDRTGQLMYSWRLFYDSTVPYCGKKHLPYAVLAFDCAHSIWCSAIDYISLQVLSEDIKSFPILLVCAAHVHGYIPRLL